MGDSLRLINTSLVIWQTMKNIINLANNHWTKVYLRRVIVKEGNLNCHFGVFLHLRRVVRRYIL